MLKNKKLLQQYGNKKATMWSLLPEKLGTENSGEFQRHLDTGTATIPQKYDVEAKSNKNQQPESFMHFVVTLLLSYEFKSRVFSLGKNDSGSGQFFNLDMIMIRDKYRDLFELENIIEEQDRNIIALSDTSPKLITTAIELKPGKLKSEAEFYSALVQTLAAGAWANERILVYIRDKDCFDVSKNSRFLEIAKKCGVGLFEVNVQNENATDKDVEAKMIVHLSPRLETTLDFTSDQRKLLSNVAKYIKDFQEEGCYLDTDQPLFTLLMQAKENLMKQVGFTSLLDIETQMKQMATQYYKNLNAIFEVLTTVINEEESWNSYRNEFVNTVDNQIEIAGDNKEAFKAFLRTIKAVPDQPEFYE